MEASRNADLCQNELPQMRLWQSMYSEGSQYIELYIEIYYSLKNQNDLIRNSRILSSVIYYLYGMNEVNLPF